MKKLHIVFDGFPDHETPRFIEVEDSDGKSINVGEWHRYGDLRPNEKDPDKREEWAILEIDSEDAVSAIRGEALNDALRDLKQLRYGVSEVAKLTGKMVADHNRHRDELQKHNSELVERLQASENERRRLERILHKIDAPNVTAVYEPDEPRVHGKRVSKLAQLEAALEAWMAPRKLNMPAAASDALLLKAAKEYFGD